LFQLVPKLLLAPKPCSCSSSIPRWPRSWFQPAHFK